MSQSKASFSDYDGFVEKFKPKKTTDDCYTPKEIYDEVLAYCVERWGIDPKNVVRPFWPGSDYEAFDYPDGCVVIDNPPFSILSKIQRFYIAKGIRFFLFAPSLTLLSSRAVAMQVDHIVCACDLVYENGARVRTGFVTNLEPDYILEAEPELGKRINAINDKLRKANTKSVGRYIYPYEVLTAARMQWMAAHNTPYKVKKSDCCVISALDSQRAQKKAIFGGALLLSKRAAAERAAAERAAAERAAAERAAATVWELSDREKEIQEMLG